MHACTGQGVAVTIRALKTTLPSVRCIAVHLLANDFFERVRGVFFQTFESVEAELSTIASKCYARIRAGSVAAEIIASEKENVCGQAHTSKGSAVACL